MKKVFLAALSAVLILSSCATTKNERKNVQEDFAAFKTYVEEASIQYYEKTENKEQTEESLEVNYSSFMKSYNRQKKWLKEANRPVNYENEVAQEAVINTLYWYFRNNNFADGHLSVGTDKSHISPCEKFWFLQTDCFLEKKGDDFFVFQSGDSSLVGKKYTGDLSNLKFTVLDGRELYVYSFLGEYFPAPYTISLENQDYELQVFNTRYKKGNSVLEILPSEKSLYVKVRDFSFTKNHKDFPFFEEGLRLIAEKIQNKESVVIDLRENGGGIIHNVFLLLQAMNGKLGNSDDSNKFYEYMDTLLSADQKKMNSAVIAKASYEEAVEKGKGDYVVKDLLDDYKQQLFLKKKSVTVPEEIKYNPEEKISGDLLSSKVIVLCDYNTASASEILIALLYELYGDTVILVGENTCGCTIYGNPFTYVLPNSKVKIRLTSISAKETPLWKSNEYWHGEGKGFYPDYWCSEKNILDTVRFLTNDDELYDRLIQVDY